MQLHLWLISAPGDLPLYSAEYQNQLREFEQSLKDEGLVVDSHEKYLLSEAGGIFLLGDFSIKVIATLGPVLGAVVGAWLHGRYGRKVRVKITEAGLEAEAQSVEEVEKLLNRAEEIQQRNRPKAIHES